MPIRRIIDQYGHAFQYGTTGHKYYFNPNNERSISIAYVKALKQSEAINASKYKYKYK